jgi:hypothetical protein
LATEAFGAGQRLKLQAGRGLIRTRLPAPQTKPLRTMRPSCKSVASQTVACPQNSRTMVEVHENPQNLQSPSSSTSAADSMGLRRLLMTHIGGAPTALCPCGCPRHAIQPCAYGRSLVIPLVPNSLAPTCARQTLVKGDHRRRRCCLPALDRRVEFLPSGVASTPAKRLRSQD